jgi:hypothetical protein
MLIHFNFIQLFAVAAAASSQVRPRDDSLICLHAERGRKHTKKHSKMRIADKEKPL